MPIKPTRNEAIQPFQDITDQFTGPAIKPRRRARAPGGTLGAKLRATKRKNIPSSLPPSSPPSTSSRLPWVEHEHEHDNDENVHPSHILTSDYPAQDTPNFDFDLQDAHEDRDFIAEAPEDWAQDDLTPDIADMSDPFGFFAVEKQLKAERTAKPASNKPAFRAVPSPPINMAVSNSTAHNDWLNPSTPHKRVDKRRAITSPSQSSDGFFNPNTSSMPSTPSPSKPASSAAKAKAVPVGDDSDPSQDADEFGDGERTPAKKTRTRASRRLMKKPRGNTVKEPRTPLVNRPTRRMAPAQRPTEKPRGGNREDVSEPNTKKGTARKKPASSGKRGKGKSNEDRDHLEVERQEKWEQERQARLEYFRKLQDYQVEKENVYVI